MSLQDVEESYSAYMRRVRERQRAWCQALIGDSGVSRLDRVSRGDVVDEHGTFWRDGFPIGSKE